MVLLESHKVPKQETPIRLQEYIVGIFSSIPTKSGIKKAIKKDLVHVNGRKATTALFIHGDEFIELYKPEENTSKKQFIFPLEVFKSDHLLLLI